MAIFRCVRLNDVDYPLRLAVLPEPPVLWVAGSLKGGPRVAIVGTRKPAREAEDFAAELAGAVVQAGGVVLSGGARGIDAAAHRGALACEGATWAVLPGGYLHPYPRENVGLFEAIAKGPGALVCPFAPGRRPFYPTFLSRNGVLVALADVLVVVQAGIPSGALSAARWARVLGRPLWVVPPNPWTQGYEGCAMEIERGARPLMGLDSFLCALGLRARSGRATRLSRTQEPLAFFEPRSPPALPAKSLSPVEHQVLEALCSAPLHLDQIGFRAGLSPSALATALLTLALENVVVEGPEGFFRRQKGT